MPNPNSPERGLYTEVEFSKMLKKARVDNLGKFFQLRNSCILSILWKSGKRVSEVVNLRRKSIAVEDDIVRITFPILKKRREGEFAEHSFRIDSIMKCVTDYLNCYDSIVAEDGYVFPTGKYTPPMSTGKMETTWIAPSKPLTRRALLKIVKRYTEDGWIHLFRESRGARIARAGKDNIITIFKVKSSLDLGSLEVAYRYVDRYGKGIVEAEPEVIE